MSIARHIPARDVKPGQVAGDYARDKILTNDITEHFDDDPDRVEVLDGHRWVETRWPHQRERNSTT